MSEREIISIAACRPDLTIKKIKKEIDKLVKTTTGSYDYWETICKHEAMFNGLMPWERRT